MRHVVNFSGGLCSFWAAKRVVEKFGTSDVVLLFADTLIEDRDLYQFNAECSAHLGIPITRVCEGRTPWQLFRDHKMIGNARFPICSIYLKRELLDEWHRVHCMEMDTVVYIGFDWLEVARLAAMREANPFWRIEAPMLDKPLWDKCKMIEETERLGIHIPRAYRLKFPHNNCGMRCVRAGISHWVHLLNVLPDSFAEWETEEIETQQELAQHGSENAHFTILKDRRNGEVKPLLLRDLRLRVEAGEQFSQTNWGGCGCGAQYAPEEVAV